MAAGTFVGCGTDTLSATAPGVQASTTITVAGAVTSDIVLVTPMEDVGRDAYIKYGIYATVTGASEVTVYASGKELPEDVDFQYYVCNTA